MRTNTIVAGAAGAFALAGLHGCTSVQMVGYQDGWVKTSTVSYHFQAPPQLQDVRGQTYNVAVRGYESNGFRIAEFDRQGMHYSGDTSGVNVQIVVELGQVSQGEPGAMKLGGKYYPAFEVTVPYKIAFKSRDGSTLSAFSNTHSDHLTFDEFPGFETREQAVGVLDSVRKHSTESVETEAYSGAYSDANKKANSSARSLFKVRDISMEVPVVRAAAGLDLESAYTTLAEAEGPDEVQTALSTYQSLGTQQRNEDGTVNNTANYGVACGIAACKLMLRDLSGAWEACKMATGFEPEGNEAEEIQSVIYQQEEITGVRVIPEEDRAEIDRYQDLAESLEGLLGAFGD